MNPHDRLRRLAGEARLAGGGLGVGGMSTLTFCGEDTVSKSYPLPIRRHLDGALHLLRCSHPPVERRMTLMNWCRSVSSVYLLVPVSLLAPRPSHGSCGKSSRIPIRPEQSGPCGWRPTTAENLEPKDVRIQDAAIKTAESFTDAPRHLIADTALRVLSEPWGAVNVLRRAYISSARRAPHRTFWPEQLTTPSHSISREGPISMAFNWLERSAHEVL